LGEFRRPKSFYRIRGEAPRHVAVKPAWQLDPVAVVVTRSEQHMTIVGERLGFDDECPMLLFGKEAVEERSCFIGPDCDKIEDFVRERRRSIVGMSIIDDDAAVAGLTGQRKPDVVGDRGIRGEQKPGSSCRESKALDVSRCHFVNSVRVGPSEAAAVWNL